MGDRSTGRSAQPSAQEPASRQRRPARIVLTGVALVLLVWFAVANFQDVRIHFWVSTTSAPLIVVIVISGFLGASVSGLWSRRRRKRREAGAGD